MASAFHQIHCSANPRAISLCRCPDSQDARTGLHKLLAVAHPCPRRLREVRSPELASLAVKMWKVPSAEQLLVLPLRLIYLLLCKRQHFSPLCRKATFWVHHFSLAHRRVFFPHLLFNNPHFTACFWVLLHHSASSTGSCRTVVSSCICVCGSLVSCPSVIES